MKIIAGLGNPGREYAGTPHNVGFAAVDAICSSLNGEWRIEPKFKMDMAKVRKDDLQILLVRPMTFMNLSGEAVGAVMRYFRIEPSDLIVISDDVNLDPGRVRVRATGGDGGHNGLKSIISHVGTKDFTRVRIGVGRGANNESDLVGHVLGQISPSIIPLVEQGIEKAAEAAVCAATEGTVKAMDAYNIGPESKEKSEEKNNKKQPRTNELGKEFKKEVKHMRRKYEALFIFAASVKEEDLEQTLASSTGEIEKLGGIIESTEIIGRLPFARTMKKETHGTYAKVRFEIEPARIKDIPESFKHSEEHFRIQIVTRNERIEAAKAADDMRRSAFKARTEAEAEAVAVADRESVAEDDDADDMEDTLQDTD